jgi:hypothetical protein
LRYIVGALNREKTGQKSRLRANFGRFSSKIITKSIDYRGPTPTDMTAAVLTSEISNRNTLDVNMSGNWLLSGGMPGADATRRW